MVIFHSYVSLPEGTIVQSSSRSIPMISPVFRLSLEQLGQVARLSRVGAQDVPPGGHSTRSTNGCLGLHGLWGLSAGERPS